MREKRGGFPPFFTPPPGRGEPKNSQGVDFSGKSPKTPFLAKAKFRSRKKEVAVRQKILRKLELYGIKHLTDQELLALLAAKEEMTAKRLFQKFGSLLGIARATLTELQELPGIGSLKACQILAAFELGRRAIQSETEKSFQITSSEKAYRFLVPLFFGAEQEIFLTLGLDSQHRVKKIWTTAVGSLTSCFVHPREVFRPLLREGMCKALVAHNHPSSGDPTPSEEDLALTQRLFEVGELVGIPLLDHLILGEKSYVSLHDQGIFPTGKR